jgi:hypothetical protein
MSRGTSQSLPPLTSGRVVMAACVVLLIACTDKVPTENQLASGSALAAAQGTSAVYTTDKTGTVVDGNIYEVSGDVYISGGPQNTKASGPPNGTYYFQVTDPSGKTLLSSDPAACRQLTVAGGRVVGSAGPACKHPNGSFNPANGATPVKLAPFSSTPNAGREYKVWMVLTSKATISASDPKVLVFKVSDALTDNFKVNSTEAPQGSCAPSSSLSVLVAGADVTAYVPKGNWSITPVTGIGVTNIEGSSIAPTLVPTVQVVNSCATNAITGETVCVANNGHVYLLSGTTLGSTLTSGGSGVIGFSGGACTNCSVAMDATHNRVVIGLANGDFVPAFQFLNLGTSPTFEPVFNSPSGMISEDPLIDPIRNLLLSAAENNKYEIIDITNSTTPLAYENSVTTFGELDSSGEDCSTGIALAPSEFTGPSEVFIADLTQATFVAGSPGAWTAPSQVQSLSESFLSAGASGLAVAQGTHTGIVTGEFFGDAITGIALPATSGSGIPAIGDWVTCAIPGWSHGFDPHTVTAYKSPSSGNAIAVLANAGATSLAVVDLTKMLDATVVPRTVAGHGCAAGVLPPAVVHFVPVP